MPDPVISIITPAYNRADEIDKLIQSIHRQDFDRLILEHIISDDGSVDNTREVVERWQNKVDFSLHFITQENQGPGAARNHGLEVSKGELILFIDSDCEADPNWVKTIVEEYDKDGFDACGGPDGAKEDFTPLQKAIDFSMTSFFTTGGMRGHSEKMLAKFYPRTHNMGMTRKLYEKVGGFGSLRHGQDIELSHRIRKSSARVKFIPDAVVYHRRRTSIRQFFKQVFNWGVARVNLYNIDQSMLEPIHLIPATATLVNIGIFIGLYFQPEIFIPIFNTELGLLALYSLIGGIKQRSFLASLLTVIIIPIQIGGYGLGFMWAFFQRNILGKMEITGFVKKYYK